MKRDRLTFGMIVGIPIIQLVLFGFAITTDAKGLPAVLVSSLANSPYFKFTHRAASEAEGDRLLKLGDVQFMLVIPSDFSRKLQRGALLKTNGVAEFVPGLWPIALFMLVAGAVAQKRYRQMLD